jgi:hypothetical protein
VPVQQKRGAVVLHSACERPDVIDLSAFVAVRQPQQHGGKIAGGKSLRQDVRRQARIPRGHKIKTRCTPGLGLSSSGRHDNSIASAIGRKLGRL